MCSFATYIVQALSSRMVKIREIMIETRTPSRLENMKNIRHLRSFNDSHLLRVPLPMPKARFDL